MSYVNITEMYFIVFNDLWSHGGGGGEKYIAFESHSMKEGTVPRHDEELSDSRV
jgi:hypothetical protein